MTTSHQPDREMTLRETVEGMARIYERPGFLLRRCHQISVSIFMEECADLDLTATQFGILYCISHHPGADQVAVSKMLGLDRSTTAMVIDRLVGRELVSREVHSTDRRRRSLTLTAKGAGVLKQTATPASRAYARLLEPLAPRDRETLLSLLTQLAEAHASASRVPFEPESATTRDEGVPA